MTLFDALRQVARRNRPLEPAHPSPLTPAFLHLLADPAVRTVLLAGCGGGFDFVHSLTLVPELRSRGKRIVICSYSFGDPRQLEGEGEVVFREGEALARRVTPRTTGPADYCPEVHVASYLARQDPGGAPHPLYACYARAFCVPVLRRLYAQLCTTHAVDAVVLVDGGSDSLMVGDEAGLGDPLEDAVSVAAVAGLEQVPVRLLLSLGLGADRFNQVSDAASLRAVAELTRLGGYRGAIGLEPAGEPFRFYQAAVDWINGRQTFRSVLAGCIVAAGQGSFGNQVPEGLAPRVRPGEAFLWPLMAVLWAFDVEIVARRSLIVDWIKDCPSVGELRLAFFQGRAGLGERVRPVEQLPRQPEARARW